MKEGQTQEPVKVFIADFKNKVLREKYTLNKEEFELTLRRKHGNFWNDYYRENEEKYIASLKQYPATWLTIEMDGNEMSEGIDFRVCKAYIPTTFATRNRIEDEYDYYTEQISKPANTPPPAPIKTEGEDEWKEKFVDWLCHELRGTTPNVIERIVDHVERYIVKNAIWGRKFTLKEALWIWDAGYQKASHDYPTIFDKEENQPPSLKQYFKDKFDIEIK